MTAALALLLASAAWADDDWNAAVKENTSTAYARYARTHPGTTKAATALRRAEDLAWDEAVAANTALGFEAFRSGFPGSPRAAEAASKAEALAWEEATAGGNANAFTLFLARYPQSPRAAEANARIEEAVWHEVRTENTEASYGRYLLRFPQGVYVESAKEARESIAWQAAVTAETPGAYTEFLRKYDGGAHAEAAKQWLAQVKVANVEPVVVLKSTWATDAERAAILARYQKVLGEGFVAGVGRYFTTAKVQVADAKSVVWGHPHDRYDVKPDTGILVVELVETRGAVFEPDGFGTNVDIHLALYAPHARTPTVEHTLTASTPSRVTGTDASAIHLATVNAVDAALRGYVQELAQQRRPR